jgi:membrane protein involved in colicin uptake
LDFSVLVTTEVEEGVSVKRYKLRNQFLCSQKTFSRMDPAHSRSEELLRKQREEEEEKKREEERERARLLERNRATQARNRQAARVRKEDVIHTSRVVFLKQIF